MNFLAHLWIADRTHTSAAGAILGDFVKGPDLERFPEELAQGIRLHRRVDSRHDQLPEVVRLRQQIEPPLRRYAGILLDLAFDHALAHRWESLSPEGLESFAARMQRGLIRQSQWFPEPMRSRLGGFGELLLSYRQRDGLDLALARVATRLSRPYDPEAAAELLVQLGAPIEDCVHDVVHAHLAHASDFVAPTVRSSMN